MNINLSLFHFLRPEWLLAIIPLLLFSIVLWRSQSQQSSWRKIVDPALLPFLLQGDTIQQHRWPTFLLTLGGMLACIAMAGPTWEQLPQPIFRNDAALVIVLDLSRSMDAQDIKPSRLRRARFKITDILKARREGQTALVVYAADAFTVTPLTDDDETIISQLPALTTSLVPAQGSRADIALAMASQLLKQASQTQGQVLLITDEVKTSRGITAAKKLADAGYQLSILGVGTAAGAPIPGRGGMLKNSQGDIVIAKLDSSSLQRIAAAGGGQYASITNNDNDVQRLNITEATVSDDTTSDSDDLTTDRWHEAGPWLLLPLLLLAPLAFRRGIFIIACVILLPVPQPAQALEWRDLWQTPDQRAQQLFQRDKTAEAAQQFNDPAWRGSANFKSERFESALQDFKSIDGADARYNEGNTLAKMGKLKEAIKAYDNAIKQQKSHEDAIYNRELIKEQLKQQQEQKDKDKDKQEQQSQDKNQQSDQQQSQDQQQNKDKGQPPEQDQQQSEQQQNEAENQQAQQDKQPPENKEQQAQPQDQGTAEEETEQQANQTEESDKEKTGEERQAELEAAKANPELTQEQQASQEQWLKRIPDDPAGLLKRKFKYQYQQRARSSDGEQQW